MSKPLTQKQLKLLIGKEIFTLPTNNSILRNKPIEEQIKKQTVLSCGRVLVEYATGKYPIDGGCNKHNFGYIPFSSEQSALDYLSVKKFTEELKYINLDHLFIGQVNMIKEIIGKDNIWNRKTEFYRTSVTINTN